MYVMKWWNPQMVKYEYKIHYMSKCIGIWRNEQWNNEALEGLSKSVKHTKWPSALAYDEMNISLKKGWLIMKIKCGNVNKCGDKMIWC